VLLADLARTSETVASTSARSGKIEALASTLGELRPQEVAIAVGFLAGTLERLGVGYAALRDLPPPATEPTLDLHEVADALERIGAAAGAGSQGTRRRELESLFRRATEAEQRFVRGLLHGELRQGALQGVMIEAVARAAEVPARDVRRATMLAGGLDRVAEAAIADGLEGLATFRLELFQPVLPMLAKTATTVREALVTAGPAAVEWKLDGARLQIHRQGDDVRAYTRSLAEVTARLPEVVAAIRALPVGSAILDGEVIALRPDGRPHPFQETMGRFGSANGDGDAMPLSVFLFDCLRVEDEDLLDRPSAERIAALEAFVPASLRPARLVTDDPVAADRFLEEALAQGHEGVMVKSLDGLYEAGRRGGGWLKVKPARTLDLVVLAAEWGHGRRQGKLSNLHLGARDPVSGDFVMLGKTFKGMTDAMLAWQTEHLLTLATERDGHVVHVRPKLVVEIAFDGVQSSARYPGGLALRFARVKGYRPDKSAADADTVDTVRTIRDGGPEGPSGGGG